jgi:hypothetical protein
MKKKEKILVVLVVLPIAAFTLYVISVSYYQRHPPKPKSIPSATIQQKFKSETTFATQSDIKTTIQPVALEEIISETTNFNKIESNTNENRKSFTIGLFEEAGYEPILSGSGDVFAIKKGLTQDYIAIGAHYDKVEGPSKGILDNMLGCILISNIAEAMKNEPTQYTYLFLTYGNEETGRKIGSATSGYKSGHDHRPTHVIEIDYVGDKNAELGGRWMSPFGGRFTKTGIKIMTYPMPDPPVIHTERDNIDNVDFDKAYLAYKTAISLIEGIEEGKGLIPPNTVNFLRKDQPLFGN